MEESSNTWNELSELYHLIGDEYSFRIWSNYPSADIPMETEEELRFPEDLDEGQEMNENLRAMVEDFWNGVSSLEFGGYSVAEGLSLTEFGENWHRRTQSGIGEMLGNPDIPVRIDDEGPDIQTMKDIGGIYGVLGYAPDSKGMHPAGAKILHIMANGGNGREVRDYTFKVGPVDDGEFQSIMDVFYHNGFVTEEAYESGVGRAEDVLTTSAEEIYEKVVDPDFRWLENYREES